jgi:hypothetical protein
MKQWVLVPQPVLMLLPLLLPLPLQDLDARQYNTAWLEL